MKARNLDKRFQHFVFVLSLLNSLTLFSSLTIFNSFNLMKLFPFRGNNPLEP